jgi:hypothetical protein
LKRATLLCAVGLALGSGALAMGALGACSSPAVGDDCSGTCTSPTTCEVVCECGDASCPTYECVTISSTGVYQLQDGGQAQSCTSL